VPKNLRKTLLTIQHSDNETPECFPFFEGISFVERKIIALNSAANLWVGSLAVFSADVCCSKYHFFY